MPQTDPPVSEESRRTRRRAAFAFDPEPEVDDLPDLAARVGQLGYNLLDLELGHTLEEIQTTLRTAGPSAFLRQMRISEDISRKAPPRQARDLVRARVCGLKPQREMLIVDPYLMTSRRTSDADAYAREVLEVVAPLVEDVEELRLVVSGRNTGQPVRTALTGQLRDAHPQLAVDVVETEDFHDRFWIADGQRGLVMGTSLNGIGRRIFLIDDLSSTDVKDVLAEVESIVASQR